MRPLAFVLKLFLLISCSHDLLQDASLQSEQITTSSKMSAEEEAQLIEAAIAQHRTILAHRYTYADTGARGTVPSKIQAFIKEIKAGKNHREFQEAYEKLRAMKLFSGPKAEQSYQRVTPFFMLASKIYSTIEAPDQYTQLTDGESIDQEGHYAVVTRLLEKPSSFTLVVAAKFHDIERFFASSKINNFNSDPLKVLNDQNLDTIIRKRASHPVNSVLVTEFILNEFDLAPEERAEISLLIRYHDSGPDGVIVSFEDKRWEILPPLTDPEQRAKVQALVSADAIAFFDVTMVFFIEREWEKVSKYLAAGKTAEADSAKNKLKGRIALSFDKLADNRSKRHAVELAKRQLSRIEVTKTYRPFVQECLDEMIQSIN